MSDVVRVLELPVLTLKNKVVFPYSLEPLTVGRPFSLAAVEAALATEEKQIVLIAQREETEDRPKPEQIFDIGTLGVINRMMRVPGKTETVHLIVQGQERVRVIEWLQNDEYISVRVEVLDEPGGVPDSETEALRRNIDTLVQRALALLPNVPAELRQLVSANDDPARLCYFIANLMQLDLEQEQAALEAQTLNRLMRLVHTYLSREVEILQIRSKIQTDAEAEMGKAQKDYFLRQQLKAIQKELGEEDGEQAEADMMRDRLDKADLPEHVRKEAERELRRMEKLPAAAPDYHVIRTYLEWILDLPWNVSSSESLDLKRAREVLDEDHYDLEDIKDRILQHLAVHKLKPNSKSPILCFAGPPGVGKTSLGQSIARAMDRKFERMSLGGMRDEAELRGHRRTYIGAMPGRIIQSLRRAGVNNPVIMLDEIDKLGSDFRGDPSSALLEVLDPQQNHAFRDHYLDLPVDLSKVFFIGTANNLGGIPPPLRDRMEIITLSGYSEEEKLIIARRYIVPRQVLESGLTPEQVVIDDEALTRIIGRYTREAGVRQLEQRIGRVMRKIALRVAEGSDAIVTVDAESVPTYLGPEKIRPETARESLPPGVATGLAVTETGGEVLFVEAALLPGSKGLTLTGQLGEVMQESARAAYSYLWSNGAKLDIDTSALRDAGLHVHVPAGAVPKDGPSAGVAIVSAIASLCVGRPVRNDTAMTGEITLAGLVFPIGGVKEKVLAARRAGIHRVVLPARNEPDVEDVPADVRKEMEIVFVDNVDEALDNTLAIPVAVEQPVQGD
ncbi:MAG TPA: endopeptidase La [Blastocatellia bacterium]|nr:endopeptidase La [Blastocatellia bacterium]